MLSARGRGRELNITGQNKIIFDFNKQNKRAGRGGVDGKIAAFLRRTGRPEMF